MRAKPLGRRLFTLPVALIVSAINAPTYALHTASGVSPSSWDVTGDSTFQPGMWVHQQFAADGSFATSLGDYYTEVQGSDWEATSETIGGGASAGIAGAVQTFVQPTGTYFTRCRFETTPGDSTYNVTSAWSNTVTDTIVGSTAILNAATKNSGVALSGSPLLSYLASAGGGKQGVRSQIEQASSKAQFEVTVTANAAFVIGLDDGTTSFPAGSAQPGLDNSLGIGVNFAAGNGEIDIVWNSFGNFQQILGAGIWAVGDVFTIVMDTSAHTIEVWRTRSGVTTQMGTTSSSVTTLSHYYAFMSAPNVASAGTFNFGGTTYAKTPGSGVAALWA